MQEAIEGKLTTSWREQNSDIKSASILLEKIKAEKEQLIKDNKIKKQQPLPPIDKDEIPFDIPDSWEWCRFGDIINLKSGQDLTTDDYNDEGIGIPYLTGASHIIDEQLKISRWVKKPKVISINNDLLITCKGTIGKLIINNIGDIHIARQIMAIRLLDKTNQIITYLQYFIKTYIKFLKIKATSMIPGISRDDILQIYFPLPPLEEQKQIVKKIETLFKICDNLETQINNSKTNSKTLMRAVLKEAFEVENK